MRGSFSLRVVVCVCARGRVRALAGVCTVHDVLRGITSHSTPTVDLAVSRPHTLPDTTLASSGSSFVSASCSAVSQSPSPTTSTSPYIVQVVHVVKHCPFRLVLKDAIECSTSEQSASASTVAIDLIRKQTVSNETAPSCMFPFEHSPRRRRETCPNLCGELHYS